MALKRETKGSAHGTWKGTGETIFVNLSLILFEDGDCQVVYCPAVDIYGYGKSYEEASSSFGICLDEFFLYTTRKKTLASELKKLGWSISDGKKKFSPPSMGSLLAHNKVFSDIFNKHDFYKVDRQVEVPCLC